MVMIGGIMKTTSRLALVAAAGMMLGAVVTPAKAADLGGGCCGDLEERVAELEATTARKGNRVVSLQVYGQVNKALLIWDDGVDSDAFVVDNDSSGSRFGFTGKATIKPGWTAGFLMELDVQDSASDKVFNSEAPGRLANGDEGNENEIVIRYNNVYIESEKLGRITLGQGSTAADGASEVVLGNSIRNSDIQHGVAFSLRLSDGTSFSTLGTVAQNLDGGRDDVIRYDSPSIYGFILSASWGDNDYADVALRFKKEWNSVRIAAAIAYQWDETNDASTTLTSPLNDDFEVLSGSVSVMHIPTGIYGAFAAGEKDFESATTSDPSFWYAQLGIEKKWLPYGSTTVYGEYGEYSDFIEDFDTTRWGLGVVQKFDSAALELYAIAAFYSFDDEIAESPEDLSTIMIGSRIKF
jgi:hypothetical protein